ncbi:MAG TPA: tetratricopeptide repeat protein [Paracoccaceae bacterium]|nr:tetratricopeptide repeat protein [Paracoccaceae bacterium]
MRLAALILVFAPLAASAECPAPPDHGAERDALLDALAAAPDPAQAALAAAGLWQLWFTAPDPKAQDLLDRAGLEIRSGDFAAAEALLGALVAYCPAYAEGWNQRAFARFLAGDLDGSLADIAEVLAREPAHFGALSGKVQILFRQGRVEEAQAVLRAALKINPWLPERVLLAPGEPI